jgi:hypothetical protein
MANSPATFLFTVDAIGSPEPIVIQSNVVRRVTLREDNQDATTMLPYIIHVPDAASPAVRYAAGSTCVIRSSYPAQYPFFNGAIVGYIETTSSSAVFSQAEDIE